MDNHSLDPERVPTSDSDSQFDKELEQILLESNLDDEGDSRLLHDFKITRLLGAGAYGAVILSVNHLDKKSYAVKVAGGELGDALREVQNLVQVPPHKNVVHYYTCWEDKFSSLDLTEIKQLLKLQQHDGNFKLPFGQRVLPVLCIQMELCGDDLRHWLGRQKTVDQKQTTDIFLQITRGLEHIHKHNIIHRDLKPDNIFLGLDGNTNLVKIGDLGIATQHQSTRSAAHTKQMGTPLYLAPEQVSDRYGKPADLYALGLIFFELLSPEMQPTFHKGSYEVLLQCVTNLKYKQVLPATFQTRFPKESKLILKLLRVDPIERPGFKEIFDSISVPTVPTQVPIVPNAIKKTSPVHVAPQIPKPGVKPDNSVADLKKLFVKNPKAAEDSSKQAKNQVNKPAVGKNANLNPEIARAKPYDEFVKPSGSKSVFPAEKLKPMAEKVKPIETKLKAGGETSTLDSCAYCHNKIIGKVVQHNGKMWHPEHFICTHCKKPLSKYIEREQKLYCEEDYHNLFSPRCAHCKEVIRGTSRSGLGKTWHPEHFLCAHCHKPFADSPPVFFEKNGKAYCKTDYTKLFAPNCKGCSKPVMGQFTKALDFSWHKECFVCWDCKIPLISFFHLEGKIYCETDFKKKFSQ